MIERSELFSRQMALLVGRGVEKTSGFAMDQMGDLALFILQRIAAWNVGGTGAQEMLASIVVIVGTLRRATARVPSLTGRLAGGATYVGMRVSIELSRRLSKLIIDC